MAISYPTSLDSLPRPTSTNPMNSPLSHTAVHIDLASAIEALEAKVGIDGSADADSLDKRVTVLESATTHTHVNAEVPGGAIDDANVTFTLAHSPSPAA